MKPRDAQVLILAKAPVPGLVKTRLTPVYTAAEAADLALAALLDTLHAAAGAAIRRCLLVLDGDPGDWALGDVAVRPQCGGTLDQRLAFALADAYAELPVPVLLVGMDTPQITTDGLDEAVRTAAATGHRRGPWSCRGRRLLGDRCSAAPTGVRAGRSDVPCRHRYPPARRAACGRPAGPAARHDARR